jgi:hypothetical protein
MDVFSAVPESVAVRWRLSRCDNPAAFAAERLSFDD